MAMVQRIIHKHSLLAWAVLSTLTSNSAVLHQLYAAELNTNVPTTSETGGFPVQINLPAQPLNQSIRQLANQTGLSISFDSELTKNKTAPAVKGFLSPQEALKKILQGSGLQLNISGDSAVIKPEPEKSPQALNLDAVEVRAKRFYEVGPLPGLGLTKEEIPGNVQSISAKEIKEAHSLSITDLMNRKLQSVTVNDYQGNPFQMDVQYRGFTAGPQIGTPQGLSVFIDGIRVNEPFGDVVNWDMLPMNALASVDVFPGSNPIFGLNTLGGAFSLKTKDGFNNAGIDADVLTGSYGRKQLQAEAGWNNGTVGLFAAGNIFLEDGWRENSPSKVNQLFGKASYRGDKLDLNLSTLLVETNLTGNGLIPSEEYNRDRNAVFTSPDKTKNQLQQFQLSGSYFVSDTFTITGQVYRRNSDRKQKGSDVMTDYSDELVAKRRPTSADQYTCLFPSTNQYGLPDYVIIPVENYDPANGVDLFSTQFFQDFANGTLDVSNYSNLVNSKPLPDEFLASYRFTYNQFKNFREYITYNNNSDAGDAPPNVGETDPAYFDEPSYFSDFTAPFGGVPTGVGGIVPSFSDYFFTRDGNTITKNYVMLLSTLNESNCAQTQGASFEITDPVTGNPVLVDGVGLNQPGYIEGTPTALITKNQIKQVTDGMSVQLNWNLEHHKLMVGASIDAANAEYTNEQMLGFFDASRKAYLDPEQAHPQFGAAFVPLANNNFEGTNITKSVYFSETWTPIEALHFNASGRYNMTRAKNVIAARSGQSSYSVGDLIAEPDKFNVCSDTNGNGTIELADCAGIPLNYRPLNLNTVLDPAETEKFTYYSFNPSLGVSWQAQDNLNVYANVAKGTRTPSVVELGCALDKTPGSNTYSYVDSSGNTVNYKLPKSLEENRQCTLPTTLSGDPYLPQIKATTYDIGMRGTIGESMQWNLGAYQTDLKNDIYFVAVGNSQGFFDSIGDTRRRGIEAGLSGKKDKWGFALNYALTEATFENNFLMYSLDNSSATFDPMYGPGVIRVKKGNRMPGTSLNNINANVSYDVTDKWKVSLSMVAHSDSYLRGNENNEHRPGVPRQRIVGNNTILLPPTNNPGKAPAYAVFNLQTSYKLSKEWTASMIVNNIFDQEYFTAGRLGRNPFSPSINGAIGPDGYNHNSGDWLSTNFIAPGAPRGVWFSLNWHFVPD
ncbi:TonB-dependent receptor domain-containing protein [Methylophilus sp. OH31]|uniref:TonB-dependent receptor domain-containing protein n=1 Tax=Methylophilus sp. OH31 TaxID=1387312 RepID=UPI00046391C0|nr:TonB-dependent receptor [Methylophilus sp. OH31]